jgi:hypothetical protein
MPETLPSPIPISIHTIAIKGVANIDDESEPVTLTLHEIFHRICDDALAT